MAIIIFLIVLSVLVLVHELGHFWVAKRAGVWVEEFGFGLPPRVWGIKRGETLYSINLLPFGGFVKLHGESSEEGVSKPDRAFINLPLGKKVPIIVAGVIMNFILAVVAFSIVYSFNGIPKESENVRVIAITEDSPAKASGIQIDDLIREVDDKRITSNQEFLSAVSENIDKETNIVFERNGTPITVTLTPRSDYPEGDGPVGVGITTTEIYFPPVWQRPFVGAWYGLQEAFFWGGAVSLGLVQTIGNLLGGQTPADIAGPVGIYALTTEAASYGVLALINFVGILSVNLAILNIIPFPALDGGRLLFLVIEKLFGRKVAPKVEGYIHMAGMAILLLLIFAVTFSDIRKLISAGSIAGYLETILQ